ncbi:MAG: xylose isomerase [Acidobacteria bacterium]|nr:MAG: xylose isomerase [Acidobacteriota bacterium]
MKIQNRREFLQISASIAPMSLIAAAGVTASSSAAPAAEKGMRLGLIIGVGKDPEAAMKKVHDLGLPTCQPSTEDLSPEMLERLKAALGKYQIEATALNSSGPGPAQYDFYHGPETIGLVPRQYRQARATHFKKAIDFAKQCGIPAIHTHFGFIPENPNDPVYAEVIPALREVMQYAKDSGLNVLYETGQETPITLLRAIHDVGLDNQFINLDCANLILYGKGNPGDALDVIGHLVRGLHAKDGLFPTNPRELGKEVAIGQGKANFPVLIRKLKALNYRGPVTIEREISGPKQMEDIKKEKVYLEKLIA